MSTIDRFYDCVYASIDEEWFIDSDGYDDYEILRSCEINECPYECNECKKFKQRREEDLY